MTFAQRGALGGRATLTTHGRHHLAAIGRKGYLATVARHFQGDASAYHRWLRERSYAVVAECLADRQIRRAIDRDGAEIVCVEIPVLDDPEF